MSLPVIPVPWSARMRAGDSGVFFGMCDLGLWLSASAMYSLSLACALRWTWRRIDLNRSSSRSGLRSSDCSKDRVPVYPRSAALWRASIAPSGSSVRASIEPRLKFQVADSG